MLSNFPASSCLLLPQYLPIEQHPRGGFFFVTARVLLCMVQGFGRFRFSRLRLELGPDRTGPILYNLFGFEVRLLLPCLRVAQICLFRTGSLSKMAPFKGPVNPKTAPFSSRPKWLPGRRGLLLKCGSFVLVAPFNSGLPSSRGSLQRILLSSRSVFSLDLIPIVLHA